MSKKSRRSKNTNTNRFHFNSTFFFPKHQNWNKMTSQRYFYTDKSDNFFFHISLFQSFFFNFHLFVLIEIYLWKVTSFFVVKVIRLSFLFYSFLATTNSFSFRIFSFVGKFSLQSFTRGFLWVYQDFLKNIFLTLSVIYVFSTTWFVKLKKSRWRLYNQETF